MKNNKKGFTLAELLIVVAIIAVLVAIAVPLFVGALDNARKGRDDANVRSLRSAASVYILSKQDDTTVWPKLDEGETILGWTVNGKITKDGAIQITAVNAVKKTAGGEEALPTTAPTVTWTGDTCEITGAVLQISDVNALATS